MVSSCVGVESAAPGSSAPFDPLIQVSPWCCIPAAEFLSSHEKEPDPVLESFVIQSWKLIDSEMFLGLLWSLVVCTLRKIKAEFIFKHKPQLPSAATA